MGMDGSDASYEYWDRWVGKEGAREPSLSLVKVVLVETGKRIRNFPGE